MSVNPMWGVVSSPHIRGRYQCVSLYGLVVLTSEPCAGLEPEDFNYLAPCSRGAVPAHLVLLK